MESSVITHTIKNDKFNYRQQIYFRKQLIQLIRTLKYNYIDTVLCFIKHPYYDDYMMNKRNNKRNSLYLKM